MSLNGEDLQARPTVEYLEERHISNGSSCMACNLEKQTFYTPIVRKGITRHENISAEVEVKLNFLQ